MSIEAPRLLLLTTSLTLCLSGCGWQMAEQPRYDAYEPMAGREDVTSARRPPEGTIRFRHSEERPELSEELLSRGEERYNIYCALCHGRTGHGDGQIVERGFPQPPSFHTKELQQAGDLHYWSAITNGAGRMYPYASRVSPRDRWAIVEWIRVLQLSESLKKGDRNDE